MHFPMRLARGLATDMASLFPTTGSLSALLGMKLSFCFGVACRAAKHSGSPPNAYEGPTILKFSWTGMI
jgi:hypothetical protein